MKCQSEKCGEDFKAEPHDDPSIGGLAIVCPMCGAKHIAVEDISLPGGPLQQRFRLCKDTAKTGGFDHDNG